MVDELNAGKPQCPVGLNTLVLPRKSTLPPPDQTPYVIWNAGTSRATTTGVKKEEKTGLARYALKWARFPIVYGSRASILGGSRTTYVRFQSVRPYGFRENSQVTNDFLKIYYWSPYISTIPPDTGEQFLFLTAPMASSAYARFALRR